jgi:hypothetical protein
MTEKEAPSPAPFPLLRHVRRLYAPAKVAEWRKVPDSVLFVYFPSVAEGVEDDIAAGNIISESPFAFTYSELTVSRLNVL